MERKGLERRHDAKSPRRPRLLNPEQERTIEGDLDGMPRNGGFERHIWNDEMLVGRMPERFGAPYSGGSAIRLAHRLGFLVKKPPIRPVERRRT